MDMPDGVNNALEYYSPNMTTTRDGKFIITTDHDKIDFTIWNPFADPPAFEDVTMHYRSAMVQSWNKFCFQGGKVEVKAQLPGVIDPKSGNPDLKNGNSARVKAWDFYPAWPGIWLLGNLGRALFLSSTNKVWPWSFDECDDDGLSLNNQKFSACDGNPGHGLNPYQGRGAVEVDILEGGGTDISVSIQIAPGMNKEFRRFPPAEDEGFCFYGFHCKTIGANYPNVPTAYYQSNRPGLRAWYQGLRYSPNTLCRPEPDQIQTYATVKASLDKGITENLCSNDICPASNDVSCDLSLKDGGPTRWGINHDGTCMPRINGYTGGFLCNAGNEDPNCIQGEERRSKITVSEKDTFAYQMDALSANYPIHLAAYTDYIRYQIEWVTGSEGYIRYMVNDITVYEIPAHVLEKVPQGSEGQPRNPSKLMVEEPLYLIFNVAVSTNWGVFPPNPGESCYGTGQNDLHNRVCDGFPMDMKIDYIRVWQRSNMSIGCDPASHPTRQYIEDHIEDYSNADNPWIPVAGGSSCRTDDDCTIDKLSGVPIQTGECVNSRCKCFSPKRWGGPRCTSSVTEGSFGPPFELVVILVATGFALTFGSIFYRRVYTKEDGHAKYGQMVKGLISISCF